MEDKQEQHPPDVVVFLLFVVLILCLPIYWVWEKRGKWGSKGERSS